MSFIKLKILGFLKKMSFVKIFYFKNILKFKNITKIFRRDNNLRLYFYINYFIYFIIGMCYFCFSPNVFLYDYLWANLIIFASFVSSIYISCILLNFVCKILNKLFSVNFIDKFIIYIFTCLLQIFLIADCITFNNFEYHLDKLTLSLLLTQNAINVLSLQKIVIVLIIFFAVTLFYIQYLILRLSLKKHIVSRYFYIFCIISSFTVIISEQIFYKNSINNYLYDSTLKKNFQNTFITSSNFSPFHFNIFNAKLTPISIAYIDSVDRNISKAGKYPLSRPIRVSETKKLNIIFIIIDTLRYDVFNADVMPILYNKLDQK